MVRSSSAPLDVLNKVLGQQNPAEEPESPGLRVQPLLFNPPFRPKHRSTKFLTLRRGMADAVGGNDLAGSNRVRTTRDLSRVRLWKK